MFRDNDHSSMFRPYPIKVNKSSQSWVFILLTLASALMLVGVLLTTSASASAKEAINSSSMTNSAGAFASKAIFTSNDGQKFGAFKTASQRTLAVGEVMTYTIWLYNSDVVTVTASITDPIPSELSYVIGSANWGGQYDDTSHEISWQGVSVTSGESVSLNFSVVSAIDPITSPIKVKNTAYVTSSEGTLKPHVRIELVPAQRSEDRSRPVIHNMLIGEQDVLTSPTVTLHISASDNVGVEWMFIKEWELNQSRLPRWNVAKSTGWIPFQPDYPWTLGSQAGVHFVGVWVADGNYNRSMINRDSMDYADLLVPGTEIKKRGMDPYLVHYNEGDLVTAVVTPTEGDVDLFVWYPTNFGWPDEVSEQPGGATEVISFTAPASGPYIFLVYAPNERSVYDISFEPGGGPQPWAAFTPGIPQNIRSLLLDKAGPFKEPIFSQAGIDPVATAVEPDGPYNTFLPVIRR